MRLLILIAMSVGSTCSIFPQVVPGERTPIRGDEKRMLTLLPHARPGIPQAEALLELGSYYLYLPGESEEDLTRARLYLNKARVIFDSLHFTDGIHHTQVLLATLAHEEGNDSLANIMQDQLLPAIEKARLRYVAERKPLQEARALQQVAFINMARGDFQAAETKLQELLKCYEVNKFPNRHYCLLRIAMMHQLMSDRSKALQYMLDALRSMEKTGDFRSAADLYHELGFVYREIGQFQKAIDCYVKAFDIYKEQPTNVIYQLAYGIAEAFTKLKKPGEAIIFLEKVAADHPPASNADKALLERSFATSYRVARQYDLAEIHILKEAEYATQDFYNEMIISRSLAQLYVEWGRYAMAKPYVDKCIASGFFQKRALAHLHFLGFKADSAAGDYLSAMDHIMKNKTLDDEEYQQAKIRENQELQIKYETEKKDHEIKIHEQKALLLMSNERLLRQNLERSRLRFLYDSLQKDQHLKHLSYVTAEKDKDLLLQEQNIQSLEKQDLLRQTGLRQANLIKNLTIAGIILLLIILSLLYNQYRVKLRNSKALSTKNQLLQRLVDEKEWLLKEVHHRVKNSLHTIISLLESQSTYLKDDALSALQNSQHRVYAMSLIHQRLYQKESSTIIDMSVYLPELISYLKDSFDTHQQIQFITDIEEIPLDIAQAIPVGLILNEAVTNSIKYAFPGNRKGQVYVGLQKRSNNKVILSVRDTGIGLPKNWQEMQRNSLGLKLMKGLSDDLQADFSVKSNDGASVTLEFKIESFQRDMVKKEKQIQEAVI